MHVVQEGMRYIEYVWNWAVDHSAGFLDTDLASVAVIDGGNLKTSTLENKLKYWCVSSEQVKMTNFKEGVVPPPMCNYSLKLPSPVSCVTFVPFQDTSNDLCVVTCENEIGVFTQTCKIWCTLVMNSTFFINF